MGKLLRDQKIFFATESLDVVASQMQFAAPSFWMLIFVLVLFSGQCGRKLLVAKNAAMIFVILAADSFVDVCLDFFLSIRVCSFASDLIIGRDPNTSYCPYDMDHIIWSKLEAIYCH